MLFLVRASFMGLVAVGLALAPLTLRAQSNAPQASTSPEYRAALEQETFTLVNQYRQDNQLPPFIWDKAVAKSARGHSKDMADDEVDFGHDGFSKRIADLKKQLLGLQGAGENVLRTDDPGDVAHKAVTSWLNSPHHLKNIRGDYNYSGLGVWVDDKGMIYFTQIFVKVELPAVPNSTPAPLPPPAKTPLFYLAPPSTPKR